MEQKFRIGDRVRKIGGSSWHGVVVGTYSTTLTPEGYCIESEREQGSVQIYPAKALELATDDPLDLDKMLRQRLFRSAPIEEALMQIGMGQRDLPSREECREWAIKLGVPDEMRRAVS